MNKYWPPAKVLLYGTFLLFPEKLQGKGLDTAAQFSRLELTEENRQKILLEFLAYLTAFEHDELTTGEKSRPEQFTRQQEKLLLAARRQFDKYGYHPTIDLTDVWQNPEDRGPLSAPFWELIFTEHFRTGYIRITNIGYEGTYAVEGKERPLPFVEFEIVPGTLFQKAVEPPKLQKVKHVAQTVGTSAQVTKVNLTMEGRIIYVHTNGVSHKISRQLRSDMPPYRFMKHMLNQPHTIIGRQDIMLATGSSDITELIRACGFNKQLKSIFFPDTTERLVRFNPSPNLSPVEEELLANYRWDKVGEGVRS